MPEETTARLINLQTYCTIDRSRFAAALRAAHRLHLRAVRVSTATNDYGHIRTYRVADRAAAGTLALIALGKQLLSWES
jgi:hypothetical protein